MPRRAGAPDPPDETNSEDHSERFETWRRGAPSGLPKTDHAGTGRSSGGTVHHRARGSPEPHAFKHNRDNNGRQRVQKLTALMKLMFFRMR